MKKFALILTAFLAVFFLVLSVNTEAGISQNSVGWPWGGSENPSDAVINGNETTVGWANFNCNSKLDTNGNSIIDPADAELQVCNGGVNDLKACNGPGAVACSGGTCSGACTVLNGRGIDYGVNIESGNGNVTGNAWSENLGYINFQPAGPYPTTNCNPACPTSGVFKSQGRNLNGWARFESIRLAGANAGGWLGWIKMRGVAQNGTAYGVTVEDTGKLSGYGWSDELGWIDFSRASLRGIPQLVVCPDALTVYVGTPRLLEARYWSSYTGASSADCSSIGWDSIVSGSAAWSTSNSLVATVAGNTVTGVNPGSANVTVTYNGQTKVVSVNVISTCNYRLCNESTGYSCQSQTVVNGICPADNCSDTVTPETCEPIKSGSWKEVAP